MYVLAKKRFSIFEHSQMNKVREKITPTSIRILYNSHGLCGGLEMAPHVNKWSPLDGAQE